VVSIKCFCKMSMRGAETQVGSENSCWAVIPTRRLSLGSYSRR
jgi:hypothetical protein